MWYLLVAVVLYTMAIYGYRRHDLLLGRAEGGFNSWTKVYGGDGAAPRRVFSALLRLGNIAEVVVATVFLVAWMR